MGRSASVLLKVPLSGPHLINTRFLQPTRKACRSVQPFLHSRQTQRPRHVQRVHTVKYRVSTLRAGDAAQ